MKPGIAAGLHDCSAASPHLPSLFTRSVRRDTLRRAALRSNTPFCEARMMIGSASLRAAAALVWSPEAIASSTLPIEVRSCERRALLISVRFAMTRVALRAELVFAMLDLLTGLCGSKSRRRNNDRGGGRPPPIGAAYSRGRQA